MLLSLALECVIFLSNEQFFHLDYLEQKDKHQYNDRIQFHGLVLMRNLRLYNLHGINLACLSYSVDDHGLSGLNQFVHK